MRPATAISVRWSVKHARGTAALVVGFADASAGVALAREGMTVTLAVDAEALEGVEASLADERGPVRERLIVVGSGLDLAGFDSRRYDVVVVGGGLIGEQGAVTVDELARVLDAYGCLVVAPEAGPPTDSPELVAGLLDVLQDAFRIELVDVLGPAVALVAHRWGEEEERPETRRALDSQLLVDVATTASERSALIERLRAGHLARDRALADLEAQLAQVTPGAAPYADEDPAAGVSPADVAPADVAPADAAPAEPKAPAVLDAGLERLWDELDRATDTDAGELERVLSELDATLEGRGGGRP